MIDWFLHGIAIAPKHKGWGFRRWVMDEWDCWLCLGPIAFRIAKDIRKAGKFKATCVWLCYRAAGYK